MEEVPRRASLVPLAFPCFVLSLIGVETEGLLDYHSPRKHYLPEKKDFRIIFRLPFHDFDFFELILENYPIPIAFM